MPTAMDHTQIKFGQGIVIDPVTGGIKMDPTVTQEVTAGSGAPAEAAAAVNMMYIDTATGMSYVSTLVETVMTWVPTGVLVQIGASDPTAAPTPNRAGIFYINSTNGGFFVSTGQTAPAPLWIQLSGGAGSGSGVQMQIAAGVPSGAPPAAGMLYYATDAQIMFVSIGVGSVADWKPVDNKAYLTGVDNPITSQVVPPRIGALYIWGVHTWLATGNTFNDWQEIAFKEPGGELSAAGFMIGSTPVVASRQEYLYTDALPVVDANFDANKFNNLVTRYNALVAALKAHGLIGTI